MVLNLKSFSSEKELKQYNFWFDIDSKYPETYISNHGGNVNLNAIDDDIIIFSGYNFEREPIKGDLKYGAKRSNKNS